MPPEMTPEESFEQALAGGPTAGDLAAAGETAASAAQPADPAAPAATPEAPGINPNWEEAWTDVPAPIRERQRAVFEKWDRNVHEIEARFAPYKAFEQAGIPVDSLNQAMAIQQQIIDNPRDFYDRMAQAWGFTAQQVQDAFEASDPNNALDPNDPVAQRLALMEQREAQREAYLTQQQQAAQQAAFQQAETQKINNELAALKQRVGDFDETAVMEWALKNAATNRNPSIEVAYYELKRYEDSVLTRAQRQAPRVLGGGAPAVNVPPAPEKMMSDEDRLAAAMAMAKAMAEGN